VRLPDELLYKCFKWRLNQNDCLNRGYILDGYPRKYEDAIQLFMGVPHTEEEGEEGEENQKKIIE
jgi:adenylate kinase family enzyme